MTTYHFEPKIKKCPKCGATLGKDAKYCPICQGDPEINKEVERNLDLMRKGKIGVKEKYFGRIPF